MRPKKLNVKDCFKIQWIGKSYASTDEFNYNNR